MLLVVHRKTFLEDVASIDLAVHELPLQWIIFRGCLNRVPNRLWPGQRDAAAWARAWARHRRTDEHPWNTRSVMMAQ